MEKTFISEVIGDEYKEWKKDDIILIKSPTGSGKSEFIKNQLLKWCELQRKSILLLSNRTLLYEQQKNDIRQKNGRISDKVRLSLYQAFKGNIKDYDYVVCDECHYFFEDATFNRETDFVYKQIIQGNSDGVIILLSATPELIEERLSHSITMKYDLPLTVENYNLYKFTSAKNVRSIIQNIRRNNPGEKIMYFSSKVESAYTISRLFDDSGFICSKTNNEYAKYIDKSQRERIGKESNFSCNLLCTTIVLDNGINIKDERVKHIILDIFSPISTVQCFGRKRLEESEHINIYVRNYHRGEIQYQKLTAQKRLEPYNDFINLSKEEFIGKYHKRRIGEILDTINCPEGGHTYQVNECIKEYNDFIIRFCDDCLAYKTDYFRYLCDKLGVDFNKTIDIKPKIEHENLELVLIKWEGKKLYKEEERKQFVNDVLSSVKGRIQDARLMGRNTINGIIEDLQLPYIVNNVKDWSRKSGHRGKVYWITKRIAGNQNT